MCIRDRDRAGTASRLLRLQYGIPAQIARRGGGRDRRKPRPQPSDLAGDGPGGLSLIHIYFENGYLIIRKGKKVYHKAVLIS